MKFCDFIANTDLVPKDYRGKPANIFVAIQTGAELGVPPMQSLSGIAVINGRGAVWGDLLLAVIQSHPAYEWHKEWFEGEGKARVAICQMKRRGQEVHTTRFGWEDAAKANLLGKDTYKGYADRMFQMRARGFCARDKFADALKGTIIAEEAMDMPPIAGEPGAVTETQKPKAERELGTLAPSKEQNRGHGKEGMEQPEVAVQVLEDKKPEPEPGSGRRDDSVQVQTMLVTLKNKETAKGRAYQTLEFDANKGDGSIVTIVNYHKSLLLPLADAVGKVCTILFHEDKNGRYVLDDITEIAGAKWLQGKKQPAEEKPAETGIAPTAEQLGFATESEG